MEDFNSTQHTDSEHTQTTAEQTELQACKLELSQMVERAARLQADFENYKRRQEKERANWFTSAQSMIFVDLLSIIDDFERAMAEAQKQSQQNSELEQWITGFSLIEKALSKTLAKFGVTPMAEESTFDPEKHEAIMQVESDQESGSIVGVLQKGYMFKDTVLRPAKVSVAK